MTTKSAFLYASSALSVAVRFNCFSARYFSIYSSYMGDIRLLIFSTFSGIMSTTTTWLCWLSRVAIDIPTYPVPATAILIVCFILYQVVLRQLNNYQDHMLSL